MRWEEWQASALRVYRATLGMGTVLGVLQAVCLVRLVLSSKHDEIILQQIIAAFAGLAMIGLAVVAREFARDVQLPPPSIPARYHQQRSNT